MKKFQERNYDDIIHLPHHVSPKHPQMALLDRAAQFSPFAALTGHEDAIKETARLVDEQMILDEDEKAILDAQLQEIKVRLSEQPEVTITYFRPDMLKEGGTYETICDKVKKIDEYEGYVILESGQKISIKDMVKLGQIDCC